MHKDIFLKIENMTAPRDWIVYLPSNYTMKSTIFIQTKKIPLLKRVRGSTMYLVGLEPYNRTVMILLL